MTLKEVINNSPKRKSSTKKTPQFYNRERLLCIQELSQNENVNVRRELVKNEHTPTTILKEMLEREKERDVLKEILLHPNLPVKTILSFVSTDSRSSMFDEDEEITELVTNAVK